MTPCLNAKLARLPDPRHANGWWTSAVCLVKLGVMSATDPLVFTPAAASKVRELILEEANPNLKLRVYITGGGCSGFQYGFTFDEALDEGDVTVSREDVTLVVDPLSFQYLEGAEVDYTENLQGARFVIKNPNAATTCSCGSSFGIA